MYLSSALRPSEVVWMNYVLLDPLGRGYVGSLHGATHLLSWNWWLMCLIQIWKSLPKWRIIGGKTKNGVFLNKFWVCLERGACDRDAAVLSKALSKVSEDYQKSVTDWTLGTKLSIAEQGAFDSCGNLGESKLSFVYVWTLIIFEF